MPAYRIGFGSDFVLKDQKVGIGTADPRVVLDVVGTLKGDLSITGVTTLTSYAGFVPQKQLGDDDTITNEVNTISEDIIVSVGKTFTVSAGTTANIGTLRSVSIGTHFSPPNGGISLRPEEPVEGMVRFNDDLNTLEFYNGVEWRQFTVDGSSGRGVFGGGGAPSTQSTIEFINTSSLGNALDFGVLTSARTGMGGCSSSIRGIFGGGTVTSTNIEYITLASQGNGISFGSLSLGKEYGSGLSSSTRGIFGAGQSAPLSALTNVIDYIQISTLGNALDFGDLINPMSDTSSCASPTRGIFGGGYTGPGGMGRISTIQSLTISSTGNTVKFGDLTDRRSTLGACSNSVRGMFGGGAVSGAPDNKLVVIDYITITSFGNSVNFGDLTQRRVQLGSLASQTRGFWAGGYATAPIADFLNIIDYVTIATTGNSQDFGDLTKKKNYPTGLSDSHGGLGGF